METKETHKFHCSHCKIFIFGTDTARLASNLNKHNEEKHPMEFAGWTVFGVTRSRHYVAPNNGPRPQYVEPYGTTARAKGEWGDAKNPPDITADDIALLESEGIKW